METLFMETLFMETLFIPLLWKLCLWKLCLYHFVYTTLFIPLCLYCLHFHFQLDFRTPAGYDRTRGVEIGNKNFDLTHLEEAYTSEHWLVRIYKVKDLENRENFTKPSKPIKKKKAAKKKVRAQAD